MKAQTLKAEVREKSGKGPARQLRMRGLIPAIYYGPGVDPMKLTVSPVELRAIVRGEHRRNQLIELEIGEERRLAVVRDLEIDPVTRNILHADFYSVATDRPITAQVPLETRGRSVGVQMGATLHKVFRKLPVRAFPQDVPASITIDVTELGIGDEVRVKDLPLPEGVEVTFPPERRVIFLEYKEKKTDPEPGQAGASA